MHVHNHPPLPLFLLIYVYHFATCDSVHLPDLITIYIALAMCMIQIIQVITFYGSHGPISQDLDDPWPLVILSNIAITTIVLITTLIDLY